MYISNLLSLPVGAAAVICGADVRGDKRRRLFDLGMTPGAKIRCLFAAPSGDPRAYSIRGTVIALRSGDAEKITVRGGGAWD